MATVSPSSRTRTTRVPPWTGDGIAADHAIRGFHSASLRLRDAGGTEELLKFMGYENADTP